MEFNVELGVRLDRALGFVMRRQPLNRVIQLGQVGGACSARGEPRCLWLQHQCHLPEFFERYLMEQQRAGGAGRCVVDARHGHVQALGAAPLDQAFLLQLADSLAYGGAVHAKLLGQVLLGG
jgi:hypothetical protein